ncbi:hypothetical protein BsWGS_15512 [Bradybaena similaris]
MPNDYMDKLPPVKLPTWLSEKWVLAIWIASFSILMILSCFVFIPVAVTMTDTGGNCLLYADSRGFGPKPVCSYCVAVVVKFLCFCGLRLALLVLKLTKFASKISKVAMWFSIWGVHIALFCLDVLLAIFLLVTSCLLSTGLSMTCQNLFQGRQMCSSDYGVELPNGDVITFYEDLSMAEGAAWMTLVYWLIVVVVETLILWKNETFVNTVEQVRSFEILHM